MLAQAGGSGTVPGHHGMWVAQELDEELLACAAGPAAGEWPPGAGEAERASLVGSGTPGSPGEPERASLGARPSGLGLAGEVPGRFGVGAGFAADEFLDRLAPGAALAGFLQDARAGGLATFSDDCVVGVLRAWRRLASWAAAGELAAVAELDRRRTAEVAAGVGPPLAGYVGDELAAALTLTTRSADALLDVACGLARLPLTAAALATGQIDRAKALVIIEAVSGLEDGHAAAVETAVIGRAPGQTTGQLRAAAQRAALAVDPAAAKRRQQEARKEARVEVWDERCGTAALAGRDLPPADVLAADKHIDARARQLKAAGHPQSLSELRAQVFLGLLLGQPTGEVTPADSSRPMAARAGDQNRGGPAPGPSGEGTGAVPAGLAPPGPAPAGSVNLTMPLATWLGGSPEPGEAAGFGPLAADDARALADHIARQPGSRWCLTLTGQDGRPLAHGCATPGAPAPRRAARPDRESGPGPDSPSRDTPGRDTPGRDGPAGQEGWPRGERRSEGGGGAGRDPTAARAGPADSWALNVTLRSLAVGECFHERESRGYQPAPSLRHLVNIRQRTCGFPGCRHPAARCDQDHTIPHDQGGRTCECNLACLCRRHHQAKQAHGWRLDQPEPGILIWRLPHGRSYQVDPRRYPG